MTNIEKELCKYIFDYCETNGIAADIHFRCFGDENKFYSHDTEFTLECNSYFVDNFNGIEDVKRFFVNYLDAMWEHCESPMDRIALYIEDIVDHDDWYDVIVGGGIFVDKALV